MTFSTTLSAVRLGALKKSNKLSGPFVGFELHGSLFSDAANLSLTGGSFGYAVKVYLDFYGRIDLQVYAPMFYLGQAAHVIQDTFSHTLRDKHDDYRSIVHVMNYIDAIGSSMKETRDGLAHSDTMDDCTRQDTALWVDGAVIATTALFIAAREQYSDRDPDAVLAVLDEWVTLRPDCNLDNSFCDNPEGLSIARIKQTEPYLEAIFGCNASGAGGSGGAEIVGVLMLLIWVRIRNTRPHKRR